MTTVIRTLEGGEIATGFWGPNVSSIQLGDLPIITTQQFLIYAPITVEAIISHLSAEDKAEWKEILRAVHDEVIALPTRELLGHYSMANARYLLAQLDKAKGAQRRQIMDVLTMACTPIDDALFYSRNPFSCFSSPSKGVYVLMSYDGEEHRISAEDFIILTRNIVQGGIMGWGDGGAWPEAKAAARELLRMFGKS